MFLGEYQVELCCGKAHFPYDKEEVKGFSCYLLGYEGGSHRFITLAANDADYSDGEVELVKKIPLCIDGEDMLFTEEMIAHLSLSDRFIVFCGTGKFIDIMSKSEFDKSMEYSADFDKLLNSII